MCDILALHLMNQVIRLKNPFEKSESQEDVSQDESVCITSLQNIAIIFLKKGEDNMGNEFIMKPKVDFCFKELMADEKVRQGFIGTLLGVDPKEIRETRLLPTILRKGSREEKLGILDVRVLLHSGSQMDLEMQVAPFELWAERSLFYLSKMYLEQIQEGQDYDVIKKCIHVGILDFTLFKNCERFFQGFTSWRMIAMKSIRISWRSMYWNCRSWQSMNSRRRSF